jgi:hypothetical protein
MNSEAFPDLLYFTELHLPAAFFRVLILAHQFLSGEETLDATTIPLLVDGRRLRSRATQGFTGKGGRDQG